MISNATILKLRFPFIGLPPLLLIDLLDHHLAVKIYHLQKNFQHACARFGPPIGHFSTLVPKR
jgi:hypothetical protein